MKALIGRIKKIELRRRTLADKYLYMINWFTQRPEHPLFDVFMYEERRWLGFNVGGMP